MDENGSKAKELFNRMVKAGRRTYFITVKEAKNNKKYLTLTESKLVEQNKFDRSSVMIFPEKLGDFASAFAEACQVAA
ncbi:MAG: DUF3276 family protein [Candidatus Margulisbacteria bacterium]|nr:DUF3276 family protein [Candidatus Margulisiibacteriota bacterium]